MLLPSGRILEPRKCEFELRHRSSLSKHTLCRWTGDKASKVWVEPTVQVNVVGVMISVSSTLTKPVPVAGLEVTVMETVAGGILVTVSVKLVLAFSE